MFRYSQGFESGADPVVYRRNFGLLLWKYDYDGASTNAYQHTSGATWNDFDHPRYRAHIIAYPTVDGVIDTIAWEGYREGVDDVRDVTAFRRPSRPPLSPRTARSSDARPRPRASFAGSEPKTR